ncbi:MAG: hypothetical protein GXP45_07475 [bacterium]|nr:hypothetical protein [bacterium]
MLLWNPYFLVYDVGFLLSFSAIIGLLIMQDKREKHLVQKSQERQSSKHFLQQKKAPRYFWFKQQGKKI